MIAPPPFDAPLQRTTQHMFHCITARRQLDSRAHSPAFTPYICSVTLFPTIHSRSRHIRTHVETLGLPTRDCADSVIDTGFYRNGEISPAFGHYTPYPTLFPPDYSLQSRSRSVCANYFPCPSWMRYSVHNVIVVQGVGS